MGSTCKERCWGMSISRNVVGESSCAIVPSANISNGINPFHVTLAGIGWYWMVLNSIKWYWTKTLINQGINRLLRVSGSWLEAEGSRLTAKKKME